MLDPDLELDTEEAFNGEHVIFAVDLSNLST